MAEYRESASAILRIIPRRALDLPAGWKTALMVRCCARYKGIGYQLTICLENSHREGISKSLIWKLTNCKSTMKNGASIYEDKDDKNEPYNCLVRLAELYIKC